MLRPAARWLATPLLVLGAAVAMASSSAQPVGPDVSSHQHPGDRPIDWGKVRSSGAAFAFVKATEGHTYTNPYFTRDYDGAKQAGLVRSAYHYARPALPLSTATDQASYFLHQVGATAQDGDLPVTLDLEESGGLRPADLSAWAKAFLDRVHQQTGRPAIIYTYPYFWHQAMADSRDFTGYPLWIADYGRRSSPQLPGGWSTWTFWQTTADAHEPGVPTAVDFDRFNGDASALRALATPPRPTPAPAGPLPLPSVLPTLAP